MFTFAVRLFFLTLFLHITAFSQLTGSGTESDPFLIEDVSDYNIIYTVDGPGVWFKQTADLDLQNFGSIDIQGTYDGNNFSVTGTGSELFHRVFGTVKNLNLTLESNKNFISHVLEGGKVQNCTVTIPDGVQIFFAGIAITSAGLIEDCRVIMEGSGEITGSEVQASGGIVGNQIGANSIIRRCSVTGGKVYGGTSRGGIAGEAVRIEQCVALTDVRRSSIRGVPLYDYNGGIAGKLLSSTSPEFAGSIEDSYFRGNIAGNHSDQDTIGQFCGGIVGYAMENTSIIRCYTSSTLTAKANSAPAVGYLEPNVTVEDVFWDAEVQQYFNQLRALQLDGVDGHAMIPLDLSAPPDGFTFEAWVYPASGDPGQRVFDFGLNTDFYMYFTPSDGTNARFAITTSGIPGEQVLNAAAPLPTNTWTHIAITIDEATTTGKLYINGVLTDSNETLSTLPSSLLPTDYNYFGRSQYPTDPYFNGKIDEVRIWSVALNKDTINEWKYRYATTDHPNWDKLVSYYKMNETSGDTIVDQINPGQPGYLGGGFSFITDFSAAPADQGLAMLTSDMKNQANFIAANYNPTIWSREDGYNDDYMYLLWEKTGINPLPVELTSFTARATVSGVTLNWETATEVMNAGFDIERKTSATEWQKIGFVEGHYTTNSPKYYSFTDKPATTGKIYYRLKQIDTDGAFEYSPEVTVDLGLPTEFALEQNYPNPFNPETVIRYAMPIAGDVSIVVYNGLGEKIATLVDGVKEAGNHQVSFNADNLPSGVYFYRMTSGKFTSTRKMMLLR